MLVIGPHMWLSIPTGPKPDPQIAADIAALVEFKAKNPYYRPDLAGLLQTQPHELDEKVPA